MPRTCQLRQQRRQLLLQVKTDWWSHEVLNMWRGVTILLQMGGQKHPTQIHTPTPTTDGTLIRAEEGPKVLTQPPRQSMDISVFVDMSAVWYISTRWNLSFWHISTGWNLSFWHISTHWNLSFYKINISRMKDFNPLKYAGMRDFNGLKYTKLLTYLQIPKCP